MADITALINGIIDFADVVRQLLLQTLHAGGRGGGNDNLKVGQARLERANKLRATLTSPHSLACIQTVCRLVMACLNLVVSAETLANPAANLPRRNMRAIEPRLPNLKIVVSTTTTTGMGGLQQKAAEPHQQNLLSH